MDIQKLILAAHVNEFAQALLRSDRANYRNSLNLPFDSPELQQKVAEWDAENGIGKYFGHAYRQLIKTAEAIDKAHEAMEKEKNQGAEAAADEFLAPVAAALNEDSKNS